MGDRMKRYIMRLDDASEYMDIDKWNRIENLLDQYSIKPIVGVIPNNQDPDMVGIYSRDPNFWNKVQRWEKKGWTIALHGYAHTFITNNGGINPINARSEFAGVPLEIQKEKLRLGYNEFKNHGITPEIFFAPAHTFDENTLIALRQETNIQIISDTIANDVYFEKEFFFIPQQSGKVRKLPFKITTFCYHPNNMSENDYQVLQMFLIEHRKKFATLPEVSLKRRKKKFVDKAIEKIYFFRRIGKSK